MSGDNRSVATDALEVLGTIITDKEVGRDAIHLACLPVECSDDILLPGDHIGLLNGKASVRASALVGIVDPFLRGRVTKGEKFLLVVYPRTIESLRHVWSHPAIPDEVEAAPVVEVVSTASLDEEFDTLARHILDCGSNSRYLLTEGMNHGYISDGSTFEGAGSPNIPARAWELYELLYEERAEYDPRNGGREVYFSCSC